MAERSRRAVAARQRATERTRRHRARRRDGVAVYQIEAGPEVLDMLVRLGWLADGEAGDVAEVGRAISALIANSATSR